MSSMYSSDGHLLRDLLTRVVLVLISTALIVLAMPSGVSSQYKTDERNTVWNHTTVTAEFAFYVDKPQEQYDREVDSVKSSFAPYYTFNRLKGTDNVRRFRATATAGGSGLSAGEIDAVARCIGDMYDMGIMKHSDYARMSRDTTSAIRLIVGKFTRNYRAVDMLTPMTAYEKFYANPRMEALRPQLQRLNINDYFDANVEYDSIRSKGELDALITKVAKYKGQILKGQRIIERGDILTDDKASILESYSKNLSEHQSAKGLKTTFYGHVLFVLIMISLFTAYLHLFRSDYFEKTRSLAMVYCLITLFPVLVSQMMKYNLFTIYILPLAMLPMFIRVFLDSRTAFMAHFTTIIISALSVNNQMEFIMIESVAGLVAIYSLREMSKRAQVFTSALITTGVALITYFATQLIRPGDDLAISWGIINQFIISGVLLLLAYPLMYLIEKVFGFTSTITLFEISDTNKDLLRRLSDVAPGTFQHSITVGNIASEIAQRIGARALLVRTGALYHDIGKMANPAFFTENQAGANPHDNMPPQDSAQIIIGHVTEGVRLAEKNGLPDSIRDFILTHHGAGMAKYFYITECNNNPDVEVDKAPFTYPGPNPYTKEQAILMMADGVEAASHSLNEYTEESISNLVNKIIDGQVRDGFFHECDITFHDIAIAKKVIISKLKSIYHTRITYPELKSPKRDDQ